MSWWSDLRALAHAYQFILVMVCFAGLLGLIVYWRSVLQLIVKHLIFTGFVLYGVAIVVASQRMPDFTQLDYRARHKLPFNHRIVDRDLKRPDGRAASYGFYLKAPDEIVGKYVKVEIPENKPIERTKLAASLDMGFTDKNRVAVSFPLPANSKLIEMLDAGSNVRIVGLDESKKQCSFPGRVHGIFCSAGKDGSDGCLPVELLAPQGAAVVSRNLSGFQLVLEPSGNRDDVGECK